MNNQQNQALAELHASLHSPVSELRDAALKRCRQEGEVSTVAELVKLRGVCEEANVIRQIDDILRGLKMDGAGEALLSAALDATHADQLPALLGCLWECGGSAEGHLRLLAMRCVEQGMPVMVEAWTLIEALPEWVEDEGDLLEAMMIIQQGIEARKGGNAEAEVALLAMMWKELSSRERA